MNTCDKCGREERSEELVWLSAEDFTPREGELLSREFVKYDAVCEACYQSLLIK
jgi:hypothetical protein